VKWLNPEKLMRVIFDAIREEGKYEFRLLMDRGRKPLTTSIDLLGEYLISTEKGVFCLTSNTLRQVSSIPAFGMAVAPDGLLYLATWGKSFTSIVMAPLREVISGSMRSWREIWRIPVASAAGRIHQISVSGDSVWLANTAQNCITRLDRMSGKWLANIAPFKCSFGYPILTDHNHINGVHASPNYLVFTAFRINREAAVGVIGDGCVWIFAYRNMGIHDCAFRGDSFLFCDSYSMWDRYGHGLLIMDGVEVSRDVFLRQQAQFVRGVSGRRGEIVVGNSNSGSRDERFSGRGQIIILRETGAFESLQMPAAQVYDVLSCDGRRFDTEPSFASATELVMHFRGIFGEPVEHTSLLDVLCAPNAKRFDQRDLGRVDEYLSRS
jgi:hypothetical protein